MFAGQLRPHGTGLGSQEQLSSHMAVAKDIELQCSHFK
jgi:hypothetical protein